MSITACALTFVPVTWLIIVKKVTFCNGSSQVMKPGSPLSTRNQAKEHAMEASVISCCKEIHDAIISRQVDVDHLGFSRAYS
jgi:hypothetical protein